MAKLLMQSLEESKLDTFCTGHDRDFQSLSEKMKDCVRHLRGNGFNVRRYKIEEIVLDSRNGDLLNLL